MNVDWLERVAGWVTNHWVGFAAVVGWLFLFASLYWNVHQFRRQRRTKVITTITCEKPLDTSQSHVRLLSVNVVNDGTELNDMKVILSFPQKPDGQVIRVPLSIYTTQPVPNPFKFGFSHCWQMPNDDPSKPFEPFEGVDPKQIVFTVFSGSREVDVVRMSDWKKVLKQFADPDPKLPKKPAPVQMPRVAPEDWINNPRKW